jgi:XTP/dITP diphosphohydrolase
MIILLSSANQHKVREFRAIFEGHRVLTPPDLGLDFDYEETGETFFANAHGKAQALYDLLTSDAAVSDALLRLNRDGEEVAVIADDSGICVHALGGRPGVYSARFGRDQGVASDEQRTLLLLEQLQGTDNRDAHYVCSMVAVTGTDRFVCVQETWHGRIAPARSGGTGGFGYDPVFFLPDLGCTVADISDSEKHRLSHRGKAARTLEAMLGG